MSNTWTAPNGRVWERGPNEGEVLTSNDSGTNTFKLGATGLSLVRIKGNWQPTNDFWNDAVPEAVSALWPKPPRTAASFLEAGLGHMEDRAATYDKPQGERSMANCVAAFNRLSGHNLTEQDGWRFMAVLKLTRSFQGAFRADNYEDLAAYAALAGECGAAEGK